MLTSEQTKQYHDEGYVLLTNVFDDTDLAGWRREADRLEAIVAPPAPDKPRLQVEPEPDGGKTKLRMIEPLVDLSPVYRELSEDPRMRQEHIRGTGVSVRRQNKLQTGTGRQRLPAPSGL